MRGSDRTKWSLFYYAEINLPPSLLAGPNGMIEYGVPVHAPSCTGSQPLLAQHRRAPHTNYVADPAVTSAAAGYWGGACTIGAAAARVSSRVPLRGG